MAWATPRDSLQLCLLWVSIPGPAGNVQGCCLPLGLEPSPVIRDGKALITVGIWLYNQEKTGILKLGCSSMRLKQWIFRDTNLYPVKHWAFTGKAGGTEGPGRDCAWLLYLCMGLCVGAWWASWMLRNPVWNLSPLKWSNDAKVFAEEVLPESSAIHCCQWLSVCPKQKLPGTNYYSLAEGFGQMN